MRSLALALVLVLVGGSFAHAGDAEKKTDKKAAKKAELLKRFDKDGDGQLSKDEKKAMHEELKKEREAELLKKFDKDGDGKLSPEEKKAAEEWLKEHHHHKKGDKKKKPEPQKPV